MYSSFDDETEGVNESSIAENPYLNATPSAAVKAQKPLVKVWQLAVQVDCQIN